MITRREALIGTASTLALCSAFAGELPKEVADAVYDKIDFPVIDAHCHIFNASDLPVEGFIRQCYFHIYDSDMPDDCSADEYSLLGRGGREFFAWLAGQAMGFSTSAKKELARLRESNEKGTTLGGRPRSEGDPVADLLRAAYAPPKADGGVGGRSGESGVPSDDQPPEEEYLTPKERAEIRSLIEQHGKDEFAKYLIKQAGDDPSPTAGPRSADSWTDRSLAKVRKANVEPANTLDWAKRMADDRVSHALALRQLYRKKVKLHTPALVDYSHWLKDHPGSSFEDQVELMEQLAIYFWRTEQALFHGYMAFDPLRDFLKPGTSLQLAQTAVGQKGFVGVKLYPPMGFKCLGNAGDPEVILPRHILAKHSHAEVTKALDERLEDLYRWCLRDGVPILAHAHNSWGAGPCYGRRADPANWRLVRDKFPGIKVCLGHLGGFYEAMARKASSPQIDIETPRIELEQLPKTWEWHFGTLIKHGAARNFFADVSDYTQVIEDKGAANLHAAFVQWLRTFEELPNRLIYGTDWILLDREPNKENHLVAVYDFLDRAFAEAGYRDAQERKEILRNIFQRNAVRFLGIDPSNRAKNPGAQRLIEFYKRPDIQKQVCRGAEASDHCRTGATPLDSFRL